MPDATGPSNGTQPTGPAAPPAPTAAQLALAAGWTMAVLRWALAVIDQTAQPVPQVKLPGLPTANELAAPERQQLELNRLKHLLSSLAKLPGFAESGLRDTVSHFADLSADLAQLNFSILSALAAAHSQALLAYELGRSLRDTASPPREQAAGQETVVKDEAALALSRQFARSRIATIQGWLAALSDDLPKMSAAVVAASLGRWSEFVSVTASTPGARLKNEEDGSAQQVGAATARYLLRQGDLWLMLLTGARSTSGLLSPEGYVAAGELALRRSGAIIRRILRHYWPALVTIALALGAILALAAIYTAGAAKAWTCIAAIAGSLGISGQAMASATARLSAEAERPVFAMAEEDVMAWAITTMPPVTLTAGKAWRLRKAGIARSSSLGRV